MVKQQNVVEQAATAVREAVEQQSHTSTATCGLARGVTLALQLVV